MTSPLDSYTCSLDDLRFSDEAKARMADSLHASRSRKGCRGERAT